MEVQAVLAAGQVGLLSTYATRNACAASSTLYPDAFVPAALSRTVGCIIVQKKEEEEEEDRKKTKENTGAAAINIAFYEAVRWTQCHVSRRRHAPNDLRSWIKVRRKAEVVKVSVSPGKQIRAAVMRAYAPAHLSPVQPTPQPSAKHESVYLSKKEEEEEDRRQKEDERKHRRSDD